MGTHSIGSKSVAALRSWIVDKIIENWPSITLFLVSGGAMTYLAAISNWLRPYGPVAWGFVGLAGALALAFCALLYAIAREKNALSNLTILKASTTTASVLSPIHEHQRLNVSDFFHPFFKPTKNARFSKCELMGPANVWLANHNTLTGCGFINCEIVIVREGRVSGVTAFENCQFIDSNLYGVTLLMNYASWQNLPDAMRNSVPVISDGTVGNVGPNKT